MDGTLHTRDKAEPRITFSTLAFFFVSKTEATKFGRTLQR